MVKKSLDIYKFLPFENTYLTVVGYNSTDQMYNELNDNVMHNLPSMPRLTRDQVNTK